MTIDNEDWTIIEVISRELRIKKMLIKLKSTGKVADVVTHLKETFKMLNNTDYYVKEVVDKQNLESELNKDLNIHMPLSNLTSKCVLLCKKQYADAPTKAPKVARLFSHEINTDRQSKRKLSVDPNRKIKLAGNELVSVRLADL